MSLFQINTSFTSPIILDQSFHWVHYSALWDCLSTKDTCDAYVTMHKNAASQSSPLGFGSELLISLFNPGFSLSSTSSKNKPTLNHQTRLSFSATSHRGELTVFSQNSSDDKALMLNDGPVFTVRNYSKRESYALQTTGTTEVYYEDRKRHKGKETEEITVSGKKHVCILHKLATFYF